tara:strand:+ start:543 stop:1187 length:645 start_codon:yes stop_codon:yes gene_type:complete
MDEDIAIINTNTRSEKIKNFFINNKNKIIIFIVSILLISILFFGYLEYKKKENIKISNLYNKTIIDFNDKNKKRTSDTLIEIVNKKDPTYSPLSLYFIIDNNLLEDRNRINALFDILIQKTSLDKEIKNLLVFKKGLFNADQSNESELLEILDPLIKTESVWKSHALYLMAEFFYAKNEKLKSKEFFNQIISLENSNLDITQEAQKRLNRDFSD